MVDHGPYVMHQISLACQVTCEMFDVHVLCKLHGLLVGAHFVHYTINHLPHGKPGVVFKNAWFMAHAAA